MSVGVLDANVLVALFDPLHINHDAAHQWMSRNASHGWATAPSTVNGCVRILSHPAYPSFRARVEEVVERLREMCNSPHHVFWPDTTNLLDAATVRAELIGGHGAITDVALLALACRNHGKLVTFDRSIRHRAVRSARPENLEMIGA